MALVQVSSDYLTTSQSALTLTGIDDNSTYICVYSINPTNNGDNGRVRFTVSGSGDGTASYKWAGIRYTATSNAPTSAIGYSYVELEDCNNNYNQHCGIITLSNLFDGAEHSVMEIEQAQMGSTNALIGLDKQAYLARSISHNGIQFYYPVGAVQVDSYAVLYKVVQ